LTPSRHELRSPLTFFLGGLLRKCLSPRQPQRPPGILPQITGKHRSVLPAMVMVRVLAFQMNVEIAPAIRHNLAVRLKCFGLTLTTGNTEATEANHLRLFSAISVPSVVCV
jgi:hypothetical protein